MLALPYVWNKLEYIDMMVRKNSGRYQLLNYNNQSGIDISGIGFFFALDFFEKFKCDELIYYIVEKARVKKRVLYDDDTLEEMKRYYKIDNHDELLRFIKTHGLKNDDSEVEH
jgi:hypothetical protein